MVRVGKKVWKGEEEVKLSKLLVTFWQRHGCLPPVRAYGFWKAVKDRLERFSIKQIQRKVPSLRKRHLQIFNGNASEVKPHEAETLSIWVKMIGSGNDEQYEDDVALAVSGGSAGEDAMNEQTEIARCEGRDGMQADADRGQASGHQGLWNEGPRGEHANYGMGYAGIGGGGARSSTEKVDSSCCIIEECDEPEEVEEEEEEVEVEEMEEKQKEAEQSLDEAPECGSTQDNHRTFQREAASPSKPKQELQMLTCVTMGDLASAVRTLVEVMARSHAVPV